MRTRKKVVNGQEYYYLEETLRVEKPKVYAVFLGSRIPPKKQLEAKKKELLDKIYFDLLGGSGAKRIYLSREQLIEAEKRRRRYAEKLKTLGRAARDEKDEVDTVNFVYTTLTTEGVPVTKEDADFAYRLVNQKNVKSVRDENLRVALDMILGLRKVKASHTGLSLDFVLDLHKTIMAEYGGKKPGAFRGKQAFIYLKSFERTEEIGFRPPAPSKIRKRMTDLVAWYNENLGKLNAIELAALLHLRFYVIHPFADGNKRVSRLLLNKAFFDCGYPILNVSKETQSYFGALIKSVEGKSEKPFVEFVYNQFLKLA
jgi:Fic family protein